MPRLSSDFPGLDQSQLFELGYIAKRSGHSRGSTVDVGLKVEQLFE